MDHELYSAVPLWLIRRQAQRRRLVNGDEHKGQIFCGYCGRLRDKPNWSDKTGRCVLCAPSIMPNDKPFYKLCVYPD